MERSGPLAVAARQPLVVECFIHDSLPRDQFVRLIRECGNSPKFGARTRLDDDDHDDVDEGLAHDMTYKF